jgi:hypothetical protein
MKYKTKLYLDVDGKVLVLINKVKDKDRYLITLPGGELNNNEEVKTAEKRLESIIETIHKKIGIDIYPKENGVVLLDNSGHSLDSLIYVFSAEIYMGALNRTTPENDVPILYEKTKLEDYNLHRHKRHFTETDRKIYEWLKDGRYFTGKIKSEQEKIDESKTIVKYREI